MSKHIFIPSTKKNADGQSIQEDVEFVYWRNPKTNEEYKLLNLENDSLAPRYGIVELKPIKISNRHDNEVGFRLLSDKSRDCNIGIPIRFDPKTDNPIWQKVTISNSETYDLSIKEQRMEWIMVKNSPYYTDIVDGVEQNANFDDGMKARYKAVDKEREANTFARKLKLKRSAEDIAEALLDRKTELEETALMCGFDPKAMSTQRLWVEVVKFAENKPEEFMKIYNSDTKTELSVLRRGVLTGKINESRANGWTYSGQTLGYTEQEAVAFLKEHPQLLASIDAITRKTDKDTLANKSTPSTSVTEANARELLLKKENEELKAQLKAQSSANLTEISDKIIDAIDPEFAELLKEAKALDVKGAHKIKDKERLREKVEEKRKLKVN